MASAVPHSSAFHDLLKKVCSDSLGDSFQMIAKGIDTKEHPTSCVTEFQSWLNTTLTQVVRESTLTHPIIRVDREKMWSLFHRMRLDTTFQSKWKTFLEQHQLPDEPLFYQHITTKAFSALIKHKFDVHESVDEATSIQITDLTYEEENAIRYIGGYILLSLSSKAAKEKDLFLQEALNDLKGDDTELPTESEEWTASIDRGGLTYISEATYHFMVAVEHSLRRYLKASTAHLVGDDFRAILTKNVADDDDVQFYWTIASASVEEDIVDRLLKETVKLYITVRGFSFASSILEMYKKDGKTGTQKKKTLRQSIK